MGLFARPFKTYFQETWVGLWLLLAMGVLRFVLKPLTGIPYDKATSYCSLTLLGLLLLIVYSALAARRGQTYRDVLGISAALFLTSSLIILVAIGVDEVTGIDTYYTDPAHGGGLEARHLIGHVLAAVVLTLIGWGLGSVFFAVSRATAKKLDQTSM